MSNPEAKSLSRLELVRIRQDNYGEQLEPEAFNLIRAVAHADPDIHLALEGLNDEQREALKKADTFDAFKEAVVAAFKDRSIQVIAGSLKNLDGSIFAFNGRTGNTFEEIFGGNEEVISRMREVKSTAREILQQLRSDVLTPHREPVLTVVR